MGEQYMLTQNHYPKSPVIETNTLHSQNSHNRNVYHDNMTMAVLADLLAANPRMSAGKPLTLQ